MLLFSSKDSGDKGGSDEGDAETKNHLACDFFIEEKPAPEDGKEGDQKGDGSRYGRAGALNESEKKMKASAVQKKPKARTLAQLVSEGTVVGSWVKAKGMRTRAAPMRLPAEATRGRTSESLHFIQLAPNP